MEPSVSSDVSVQVLPSSSSFSQYLQFILNEFPSCYPSLANASTFRSLSHCLHKVSLASWSCSLTCLNFQTTPAAQQRGVWLVSLSAQTGKLRKGWRCWTLECVSNWIKELALLQPTIWLCWYKGKISCFKSEHRLVLWCYSIVPHTEENLLVKIIRFILSEPEAKHEFVIRDKPGFNWNKHHCYLGSVVLVKLNRLGVYEQKAASKWETERS